MSDRCDITDLLCAECAHCRRLPDPFAETPAARKASGEPGPTFPARFPGKCACGDDIHPGDTIRADGTGGYLANCCTDPTGVTR